MQPSDSGKFSDSLWDAIIKSQDVARGHRNEKLEVEHLVIALLEEDTRTQTALAQAGIDVAQLLQGLSDYANSQPPSPDQTQLYLGRGLDRLLDEAETIREVAGADVIDVDHWS